ncbi:hypothetical protein GCM10017784_35170 [Deinococcus indicus]|uniref:hypothetical protein n=1 Tax=Deinococcus indicus TaxID=223556 RepID=UPI00174AD945|nr:hypothetical protein [Deinococcus indicus]GHG37694.1 hypothetical protein GCM10017784_35170 [Deinococcus indicus]
MTRPPLELLLGTWRAMTRSLESMATNHPDDSVLHGDYKSRAQVYGLCADQLESALRAQAEAGAGGDHLARAAAAYREARAPLDSLRAAETAATAVCYDHLGHYIGTREQYLAMHDAIDALAEQQGRVAQAGRDLCAAALAQADAGGEA